MLLKGAVRCINDMIDDPEQNKTEIEKFKIQLKNIYFVNICIILCELGPTTNECECQTVECLLSLLLTDSCREELGLCSLISKLFP